MNLPSKDKFGNSYVSYSQIQLFLKDEKEYKDRYIDRKPFKSNAYIEFGSKVGKALEDNDMSLFTKSEVEVLNKVTRLDLFERKTVLNYGDFYVLGFIDTISKDFKNIIDYKTGGKDKEYEYTKDSYTQLCIYALSIRQETGITPQTASVEFIRRKGNAYKREVLKIANEDPIIIDVDISYDRLKTVYADTLKVVKDIENFYKNTL